MIVIDATRSAVNVVVTFDVAPRDRDAVLDASVGHAEQFLATGPGFTGGTWMVRDDPTSGESRTPDTERVVQYLQWQKRSDAESFLADPLGAIGPPLPHGMIHDIGTEVYRLGEVISVDGLGRTVIDESVAGTGLVTGMIVVEPAPGKQAWIDEYNRSETRDHIQYLSGFVSASFLVGDRRQRLAEFVQWRSTDDFRAALRDERFREHVNVTNHYSTSEVGLYRVHRTIERPLSPAAEPGRSLK